jgi:hypothetical protein
MAEFSDLFSRFWWLLFPLAWAIGQLAKNWMRHARAKEAITVLKAYAEQGKEPPAELVAILQRPEQEHAHRGERFGHYGWVPVFLFGALAAGFVVLARMPMQEMEGRSPMLIFAAIVMAGLCIGNLVAMLAWKKRDRIDPR